LSTFSTGTERVHFTGFSGIGMEARMGNGARFGLFSLDPQNPIPDILDG